MDRKVSCGFCLFTRTPENVNTPGRWILRRSDSADAHRGNLPEKVTPVGALCTKTSHDYELNETPPLMDQRSLPLAPPAVKGIPLCHLSDLLLLRGCSATGAFKHHSKGLALDSVTVSWEPTW
jgi:hypothetical protein